ncbi:hypothetical protein SZ64_04520 [Erythrobacter sp. SG61-1L]|uniref:hypothetical protein n=1 Tax=Erythrobacter sp. SG61-1L TaxID=1603897 RepID=UPI0006C931B5|nr:hypothetical protein [Erythrobacter sp. SG61-1L]KPL67432.1 hypothetical protein SZ64_04520 [Erythrobacter sp. SG61-1L]
MASAARKEDGEGAGISGEYSRPDAERAFEIYDNQIKAKQARLAELRGDLSDPYSLIKDECHFPRKVLDFIVHLENQEDAKRDHMLLALSEGLKHRKLFLPRDLVTLANGEDGNEVIPTGERERPKLATLHGKPADDGFEASEEELAAQKNRPSTETAQAEADAAGEAEAAE